jgi:hypothetical protein
MPPFKLDTAAYLCNYRSLQIVQLPQHKKTQ